MTKNHLLLPRHFGKQIHYKTTHLAFGTQPWLMNRIMFVLEIDLRVRLKWVQYCIMGLVLERRRDVLLENKQQLTWWDSGWSTDGSAWDLCCSHIVPVLSFILEWRCVCVCRCMWVAVLMLFWLLEWLRPLGYEGKLRLVWYRAAVDDAYLQLHTSDTRISLKMGIRSYLCRCEWASSMFPSSPSHLLPPCTSLWSELGSHVFSTAPSPVVPSSHWPILRAP